MRLQIDLDDPEELALRLTAVTADDARTLAAVRRILTLVADVERENALPSMPDEDRQL